MQLGAEPKANLRTRAALEVLLAHQDDLTIYTVNGEMGEQTASQLGFNTHVIYQTNDITTPEDTEQAAKLLVEQGVDLILFAGGDGTARNICHAVGDSTPVLGIPAGCKIHSGVYAITPKAAGRVVEMLVKGELVSLGDADVMDIDEEAFREGEERVIARLLDGEPLVLATGGGAFIREKTRELILEKSVSVWLRADLDLLLQRTSGRTHRPLLNNGDPRQILGDLIEARYPVYAGADIIFDCDESSKEETRDGVIALLGRSFDKDGNIIR